MSQAVNLQPSTTKMPVCCKPLPTGKRVYGTASTKSKPVTKNPPITTSPFNEEPPSKKTKLESKMPEEYQKPLVKMRKSESRAVLGGENSVSEPEMLQKLNNYFFQLHSFSELEDIFKCINNIKNPTDFKEVQVLFIDALINIQDLVNTNKSIIQRIGDFKLVLHQKKCAQSFDKKFDWLITSLLSPISEKVQVISNIIQQAKNEKNVAYKSASEVFCNVFIDTWDHMDVRFYQKLIVDPNCLN